MKQLDIFTLTERQLEVDELPEYIGKRLRLIGLREGDNYDMLVKLKEVSETKTGVFVKLAPRDKVTFNLWLRKDEPTPLWVRRAKRG